MAHPEITLVEAAIHNPDEPRHFMRLLPVPRQVRVLKDGAVLAETTNALRLVEVGKHDVYEPVLYLPPEAIRVELRPNDAATHCPLKGQASYFDLPDGTGGIREGKIAWTYAEPYDFAAGIAGRIAFSADKVTIEEAPL